MKPSTRFPGINTARQVFDPGFIFQTTLVPLIVLLLYCVTFSIISSQFFTGGVNFVFVNRLEPFLLIGLAGVFLLFFFVSRKKGYTRFELPVPKEKTQFNDMILLFLPLTPIVQYIIKNQGLLSSVDMFLVFTFFVIFSGFFIFFVPAIVGNIGSAKILKMVGLAFAFSITNMALLSHSYSWLEKGSIKIQLLLIVGVFLVTLFLYNLKNKWILYLPILVFFTSNSIMQLSSSGIKGDEPPIPLSEFKLISAVQGRIPATTPNVYLLAYDAYVPNETMLSYGIDNSNQETYLQDQGFKLYPHTYSVFADTMRSMTRVLNASTEIEGDLNSGVAGDGKVIREFKDLGYATFGLFPNDFMFRTRTPNYDFYIPKFSAQPYTYLLSAILMGEFRFDIGFNKQDHGKFVEDKQIYLKNASTTKSFVYTHTDFPSHSQNSGACLPDEASLYKERVDKANLEMKQDIETITHNDPSAIVIVVGDHGPYLTKNCVILSGVYDISEISRQDIQDRYATFLAIRWPAKDFSQYDKITVIQDIFPAVFAYMLQDEMILKTKIDPTIVIDNVISGVTVNNGIIHGGINDGEPLFLSGN
jgi:hypothetical protein